MLRIPTLLLISALACADAEPSGIEWRTFDKDLLTKARAENKLVFLDVEAVWCHWCHVMDVRTYSDARVQAALKEHFLSAKVDQDARPDLARRYEEYGWPALVILDPVTLQERAIGSGFQRPDEFLALLEKARTGKAPAIAPTTAAKEGALSPEQKAGLLTKLRSRYDYGAAGWGGGHKFVPWQNIELCLQLDGGGDPAAKRMAQETLDAGRALIDPVWGGVYQYSTDGDWKHPHFEKIMEFQAEIARVYALAHLAWKRPEDLKAAEDIVKHFTGFLRAPDVAFYTSQDADVVQGQHSAEYFTLDDAGRRRLGMPRVDTHLYSRENGFAITALVDVWRASGKQSYLDDAMQAADWIITHRSLPGGGFSHDEKDAYGPFLADQVQMGRALLALYHATGERRWLERSIACADFTKRFRRDDSGAGFLAGMTQPDQPQPVADRDENIALIRWCNLLARTTGEDRFAAMARHAMRFVAGEEVVGEIYSFVGGVLLADEELATEPLHVSIVAKKDDPAANELFLAAQSHRSPYAIIERIVPGSPVKAGEIEYPELDHAAAYLCRDGRCSLPIQDPGKLREKVQGK